MTSPLVAVAGSANMDLVFGTARMPKPGETLLGGRFATHAGGKGANQAVAIGRLDGNVAFIGCVGGDAFGQSLRASLAEASVDITALRAVDGPSGTAGIFVDDSGRNMIVVAAGANWLVTPEHVDEAYGRLRPRVSLAQLEIPIEAVLAASHAERFILNPAPAGEIPDELLARCYVLTPNESELEALTGIAPIDAESCHRAARELLSKGVENVVVTLGERGSCLVSSAGSSIFAPPKVTPVDTTAAGDAFNGALALFLAEGRELANAVELANCVGALATTKSGAQAAMPTRAELKGIAGDLL